MYLQKIHINNIRSIKNFRMSFKPGAYAGWHVVIGDNGTGKSSLVRAVALCLAGPGEAAALRQNWEDWLRKGKRIKSGRIHLRVKPDPGLDILSGDNPSASETPFNVDLGFQYSSPDNHIRRVKLTPGTESHPVDPGSGVWGDGPGWFSASYGPFRRFTGGNRDYDRMYRSNPRLAPHLSVFGEDIALTQCLDWLKDLHVKQLEGKTEGGLLDDLRSFINGGDLLPHGATLERVSSGGVIFLDGNGCEVPVEQLSDGYRSILSMTFELIRQMARVYGADQVFREIRRNRMKIDLPGVVLIDEIDAHLHPTWQRRVGHWFTKYFPEIQFIVTSHSPLVCHASEGASVWRLPVSGEDAPSGRMKGVELKRLIYGNVLEAYDTELFGRGVSRSDASKQMLKRLAELNVKSMRQKLSANEEMELNELRAILPTAENGGFESGGGDR